MQGTAPVSFAEAPLFKPSEEQWADPLLYLSLIREQAEQYGLCRIQPPESFRPGFHLDRRAYKLKPRRQEVSSLQQRLDTSQEDQRFFELHKAWLVHQGKPTRVKPTFQGREVDLSLLYRTVRRRGGFAQVTASGWQEVARILQVEALNAMISVPDRVLPPLPWLPLNSCACHCTHQDVPCRCQTGRATPTPCCASSTTPTSGALSTRRAACTPSSG